MLRKIMVWFKITILKLAIGVTQESNQKRETDTQSSDG